jgi:Mrp family chromosome partitioning ATPase
MSNLLEEATQMFDLIIIDTPPVLLVTDAVILADKVDVTLIVTRSRVTRRGALQRLVGVLGASGANLVGTVLNGVDMGSPGSYAGYYYRGSDYYGSYGDNDADKDKK